jgi:ferredoxin
MFVYCAYMYLIEIEYLPGACEGSMSCSTCHMIFEPTVFNALPAPSEEEEDTLEIAKELTDTCVIFVLIAKTMRQYRCNIRWH